MAVLKSDINDETKIETLLQIVGKFMSVLQSGRLPKSLQVTTTKIKAQPHIGYVDKNMNKR